MSERLPRVSGREVVAALVWAGYRQRNVRGSHFYLIHPATAKLVVIPVHGNHSLPIGTLASILRQADLTPDELGRFLRHER